MTRKVETRFRIPDHVGHAPVEGEYVLLDLKEGKYSGVDDKASLVWETLAHGGSLEDAIARVERQLAASREQAGTLVRGLLEDFLRRGLLALKEGHGMLKTVSLSKEYVSGVRALDRLDLEVGSGELCCLVGSNGAGKSTTIRLLLDFIQPDEGYAMVQGVQVQKNPLEAKKHVAYLPERVMLYEALTSRQNLRFFGRLGNVEVETETLEDVFTEVGLPIAVLDQKVRDMSKGMRQKLAIASVLIKDAEVLILDEPLSGLDPEAASVFIASLDKLRQKGRAILMSTHDLLRAKTLADRVVILVAGRKVADLSREELEDADLERLYMRFIDEARDWDEESKVETS